MIEQVNKPVFISRRPRKSEKHFSLKTACFFALAALLAVLDQATKYWITIIMSYGETRPIVEGIFHLTYVRNFGAAFGILPEHRIFFIIASIIMVLLIVFGQRYFPHSYAMIRLGLSFMLGGVLGNLYDRISVGYVIDFLDFRIWPVFNLADAAIVAGALLLMWGLSRHLPSFCIGR